MKSKQDVEVLKSLILGMARIEQSVFDVIVGTLVEVEKK
jgi:hypothetical protein